MNLKRFVTLMVLAAVLVFAAGAVSAQEEITLWRHISDLQPELDAYRASIEAFNASQSDYVVTWEELPSADYTEAVSAAALAGDLPCILDMDGPTVPNFAWSGNIVSLDGYMSDELLADLIPSAMGTYQGEVYSVGQFDAGVALWGRQSVLEANDIRIPTIDEPWTLDEFNAALETLAALDEFDTAIDMYTNFDGEWYTYFFSPILQSFGGDLISRDNYVEAEGILNGPEALAWGEWFQNLFQSGLADPAAPDDQAFIQGRAALAYTGSWYYPTMSETYGDDLVIMPVPDYGAGPVVGGASWQWGISSACENPDGAWAFLEFTLQPEYVAAISNATGNIPATLSAAPMTDSYAEDGPMRIFLDEKVWVVMRPETPGYPTITSVFAEAANEIALGADVQDELDAAVDAIEQDIADNDGYGFSME